MRYIFKRKSGNSAPYKRIPAETSKQWVSAGLVSLLIHGAFVGWVLGYYPDLSPQPPATPTIQVTSTPVAALAPTDIGATQIPVITLENQSHTPEARPFEPIATPDSPTPPQGEFLLTDRGQPTAVSEGNIALTEAPNLAAVEHPLRVPDLSSGSGPADPLSPLLLALIEAVRASVSDPCLLALPQAGLSGAVHLTIIAADERQSSEFLHEIQQATDQASFDETRLLLDRRQCPAVTWLRAHTAYPGFGLSLQLEQAILPSGDSLRGTISGMAGYYTNLLLVDDNGVVQDLRRFMLSSSGRISFDIPAHRVGNSRDTSQLLIAIATRDRIPGFSELLGHRAEDVFPTLAQAAPAETLIGVVPFFVQ